MPMKTASLAFIALTSTAPAISHATDTLDCHGDGYSIGFHVGSEGIVDFMLFGREGPLASGGWSDLDVVKFEWHDSENPLRNVIEINARSGLAVPFKLSVSGERGSIEVENVTASVECDWKK